MLRMIGGAFYLKNVNLYVVRRNTLGEMRNSAPCKTCCKLIKKFNIKNIIYSNKIGQLVKIRAKDFNNEHISLGNKAIEKKNPYPF